MAIVRNSFIQKLDGDSFTGTASNDDEDETCSSQGYAGGGVFEDGASDADSGMGSDELDLSELGEPGTEICQVGNQSCSFPLDLYDVPNLGLVLSLETWNECLTEEERFALAEYLPDLDQENFAITLKELFSGSNFHFCSPLVGFFNQLKTGLCDPRVVLYCRALNIFQKRRHYHQLCKYQNSLVGSLVQIRDAWQSCNGYGIEERLRLLNIRRSQRTLDYNRNGGFGSETNSDSSGSTEAFWNRRLSKSRGTSRLSQKASFNALSHEDRMPVEPVKLGKEKAKGMLKVVVPKVSSKKRFDGRASGTDWSNVQGRGANDYYLMDASHGIAGEDDWDPAHVATLDEHGLLKSKRKDVRMSSYLGSNKSDQIVTISSYDYSSLSGMKSLKKTKNGLKYSTKELLQRRIPNGSHVNWSNANWPNRHGEPFEEAFSVDNGTFDGLSRRGKKLKSGDGSRTGKSRFGFDCKVSSFKAPPLRIDSHLHSDYRTKSAQGNIRASSHHGGVKVEFSMHSSNDSKSEETHSDSFDHDGDKSPYEGKSAYPSAPIEVCQSAAGKLKQDLVNSCKQPKSNAKLSLPSVRGMSAQTVEVPTSTQRTKKKVKTNENDFLDDDKQARKGLVTHSNENLQPTSLGSVAAEKKRKGRADLHYLLQSTDDTFNPGRSIFKEAKILAGNAGLVDRERQPKKARHKISNDYAMEIDLHKVSTIPAFGYSNLSKRQKCVDADGYVELFDEQVCQQSSPRGMVEDSSAARKKVKKKADAAVIASFAVTPETVLHEKGLSDIDMDLKAHKKPFTLITPTIHTGFSFSIVHLLSAVRKALITERIEDAEVGKFVKDSASMLAMRAEQRLPHLSSGKPCHLDDHLEDIIPEHAVQNNLPSLTVQEIVDRVRLNPGDPCILETPEPLHDLVRGVLKIFSSRTAPLGAKGWKALVLYEKSNKTWSWVGSLPSSTSDKDNAAEDTSAETWGIPHKVLVKLVDAFANWLKSGQETLQQIGSLPAPPAMLPVFDEKERFRDLRAQKSLNTISSSSEEVRAYFQKEELLRYSIPDRAFQYTAIDGRKSIVAPLRRGGGKPTSKARDHFMLKPDRPPHVTILCLVRDAAARLPGSIGTRADVCTLIRDSQYIVEDVTDAQVNQVVSGALDRLHYERDPCVQFDGDRKLWVYLHRDRDEEDFEDDGTSSTKKWKRQRKDVTDPSEIATMNDSCFLAAGEQAAVGHSGCEFNTNLNIESSAVNREHKWELVYDDLWSKRENIESYADPLRPDSVTWGALGGYPFQENKMLCQENTSQAFDDEAFNRERPVGLSTASLF